LNANTGDLGGTSLQNIIHTALKLRGWKQVRRRSGMDERKRLLFRDRV
jgi:hypothetical protein